MLPPELQRKNRIGLIVLLVFAAAVLIFGFGLKWVDGNTLKQEYAAAVEAQESGDWSAAIDFYIDHTDYRDCKERLRQCVDMIPKPVPETAVPWDDQTVTN